jgi:hypothetical protein
MLNKSYKTSEEEGQICEVPEETLFFFKNVLECVIAIYFTILYYMYKYESMSTNVDCIFTVI